jgi:hypothetical protein
MPKEVKEKTTKSRSAASKETSSRSKKEKEPAKSKRAKKDPNAPKKNLSAYMFFSRDWRDRVKAENPDASFGKSISSDFVKNSVARVERRASLCFIDDLFNQHVVIDIISSC